MKLSPNIFIKLACLFWVGLTLPFLATSQDRKVIPSAGGQQSSGGIQSTFTVGESVIGQSSNGTISNAQGFQQNDCFIGAGIGFFTPLCSNDSAIELNRGFPEGGMYSGVGVVGNKFFPTIAGAGFHEIKYKVTLSESCADSVITIIQVNEIPAIQLPLQTLYCKSSAPVTFTQASPTGGTFSGFGMVGNTFFPSFLQVGASQIKYTYTDFRGCTNDSDLAIEILPNPAVQFSLPSNVCLGDSSIALTNASPVGGVYAGSGIVHQTSFSADSAGLGQHLITYTYQDSLGCTGSTQQLVRVNPLPQVNITVPAFICENEPNLPLNQVSPTGGQWTGNAISSNGIFSPAQAGSGFAQVAYRYTDGKGCSTVAHDSIEVKPKPTLTTSALPLICSTDSAVALNYVQPQGGVYSGVLGIASNVLNARLLSSGTINLHYTYTDTFGCESVDTSALSIIQSPQIQVLSQPKVCQNLDTFQLANLVAPAAGAFGGQFVSAQGQFLPLQAAAGLNVVSYTATNAQCTAQANIQIEVVTPRAAQINFDTLWLCPASSGTFLTQGAPLGGTWSGSAIDSLGRAQPSRFQLFDKVFYTYIDSNNCTGSDSATLAKFPATAVQFNAPELACSNDNPITLQAAPSGGIFNGLGVSGNLFNPAGKLGNVPLQYAVVDANNCTSIAHDTVLIRQPPNLHLAADTSLCEGDLASIQVGGALRYYWSNMQHGPIAVTEATDNQQLIVFGEDDYCTASKAIQINVIKKPIISFAKNPAACGKADGILTADLLNTSGNWTYRWSDGRFGKSIAGIEAGIYQLTISGSNGCTYAESVTLPNLGAPNIVIDSIRPACLGDNNGYALLNTTLPVYWSHGAEGNEISSFFAGRYAFATVDGNNCVGGGEITIPQINNQTTLTQKLLPNCGGSDGAINLVAPSSHVFAWSNGNSGNGITSASAAIYQVTTTVGHCDFINSIALNNRFADSSALLVSRTASLCDGGVVLSVPNLDSNTTWNWNNGMGSNPVFVTQFQGTQSVLATLPNGCISALVQLVGEDVQSTNSICGISISNNAERTIYTELSPANDYQLWEIDPLNQTYYHHQTAIFNNGIFTLPYAAVSKKSNHFTVVQFDTCGQVFQQSQIESDLYLSRWISGQHLNLFWSQSNLSSQPYTLQVDSLLNANYSSYFTASLGESSFRRLNDSLPEKANFRIQLNDNLCQSTPSRNLFSNSVFYEFEVPIGLAELKENAFSLYPNPATAFIRLQLQEKVESLNIFSASGQLVYQSQNLVPDQIIDVSGLPQGNYLIEIVVKGEALKQSFIKI